MESYKIKKGTIFKCGQCKTPLFELNRDVMSTDTFNCILLEGIGIQPNLKPEDSAICSYCGAHLSVGNMDMIQSN